MPSIGAVRVAEPSSVKYSHIQRFQVHQTPRCSAKLTSLRKSINSYTIPLKSNDIV